MADPALQEDLQRLETRLHRGETRRSPSRLAELLHPDFEEFARSGGRYTRAEVLSEFSPGDEFPEVVARGFELASLGEDLALLTYTSAHVDESGELHRFTLRASLWVLTADGWRLRFHQGTPTDDSASPGRIDRPARSLGT